MKLVPFDGQHGSWYFVGGVIPLFFMESLARRFDTFPSFNRFDSSMGKYFVLCVYELGRVNACINVVEFSSSDSVSASRLFLFRFMQKY